MVIGAGIPIGRTPTVSTNRRASGIRVAGIRVAGIRVTGASGVKAGAAVTGTARIVTRPRAAEVRSGGVTGTAETSGGCITPAAAGVTSAPAKVATATPADVATAASTMTTTAAPAVTTATAAAAMLGDSRRRNGHCRCQYSRHQNEAPTLDAHDCLHNPVAEPSPSTHCEPLNTET
jgi:hypothetical protein